MECRQLQSLIELADLGSITRVAEKLNLTPPAIHKELRSLEAELGVSLYEKVDHRLHLTQAGEVLLPFAREMLATSKSAAETLKEWKNSDKGLLRIGAGPGTSSNMLPQMLRAFCQKFPDIQVFVETGTQESLLKQLSEGAIDLALIVSSRIPEGLGFSTEMEWPFQNILVTSVDKVPSDLSASGLSKQPFVLFTDGSRLQNLIDLYFAEEGIQPSLIMRFDNLDAVKAMVRLGSGISLLPLWTIEEELHKGLLVSIQQRRRPLIGNMELVVPTPRYRPASVEAFVRFSRTLETPWLATPSMSGPLSRGEQTLAGSRRSSKSL